MCPLTFEFLAFLATFWLHWQLESTRGDFLGRFECFLLTTDCAILGLFWHWHEIDERYVLSCKVRGGNLRTCWWPDTAFLLGEIEPALECWEMPETDTSGNGWAWNIPSPLLGIIRNKILVHWMDTVRWYFSGDVSYLRRWRNATTFKLDEGSFVVVSEVTLLYQHLKETSIGVKDLKGDSFGP